MFIYGRCHRSSAVVTPAKYGCDQKNLIDTFARSKILLTEKLANGALVTPTPGGWSTQQGGWHGHLLTWTLNWKLKSEYIVMGHTIYPAQTTWWCLGMNRLYALLAHCVGNPLVKQRKGPVIQGFDTSFLVFLDTFLKKKSLVYGEWHSITIKEFKWSQL